MNENSEESTVDVKLLVREGDLAGDYIERLLDITETDGDIDLDVQGDRAIVAVVGDHLNSLIGPRGATLEALQELTRIAVSQQTGERSRLMLDIGGYRARRRSELKKLALRTAEKTLATKHESRLEAMNSFERKIIHDEIAGLDGVTSESEGEEPNRRVVIFTS